ncbi:MAG: leucyl aminopeptidase [Halieaceae bacterium]|jgi:leucyl aminopeptidase|nr:leucyl aminopeptidase [Halieaceae bacterium]
MEISAKTITDASKAASSCAIVPVFAKKQLSTAAKQIDKQTDGLLTAAVKAGEISGETGQTLMLHTGSDKGVRRVLMIGAGARGKLDMTALNKLVSAAIKAVTACKAKDALFHAEELLGDKTPAAAFCELLGRQAAVAEYRYSQTVSKPKPAPALTRLQVNLGKAATAAAANRMLKLGRQVGEGINTARELGNLPGNICTPSYLASEARKLARKYGKISTRIVEEKQMKELGMGSFLSVSAGSDQPAKLIVMQYKGAAASAKPYVLVGKGITFDSGGISLKPGAKMDEMKFDMCGAASVFGTMQAVAEMGLSINVVGLVAASENLPSGSATKPGDVVTSMSGQTIEILNTDAEGRLVLCDTLTYAERFKPAAVVDIATLTGACVVALGSPASGMLANDDSLAQQLEEAGHRSFDRAWRLPLWDDYQRQLDTPFADMANIGGPGAGTITAACFLARFAGKFKWAHLDIAGAAWDSAPKGATGRPVGLLCHWLLDRAGVKLA